LPERAGTRGLTRELCDLARRVLEAPLRVREALVERRVFARGQAVADPASAAPASIAIIQRFIVTSIESVPTASA
jgi:hypothetical protein